MSKQLIYVVDDEVNIRELLAFNLEKAGYKVKSFADGRSFLEELGTKKPDLVCLDLMLPDYDGVELCKKIRHSPGISDLPILMLTARTTEFDTVIGLEAGADDYLGKPFSVNEFLARVRALLRRTGRQEPGREEAVILQVEGLEMDPEKRTVVKEGKSLSLTYKEFELLKLLLSNRGRAFSREELLSKIWGYDYFGDTRTVDVHIHSLRKLIGEDLIETVRGIGYKFVS